MITSVRVGLPKFCLTWYEKYHQRNRVDRHYPMTFTDLIDARANTSSIENSALIMENSDLGGYETLET